VELEIEARPQVKVVSRPALPSQQSSEKPPAVPTPLSPSLLEEGWQSSVPVRHQTLVQLLAVVAPVILVLVGLGGFFWSRWASGPSPQEIERFQKEGAEAAHKEELEFRAKQQHEARDTAATVAENAARSELRQPSPTKAPAPAAPTATEIPETALRPSPSEESFLQQMARRAGAIILPPASSTGNKPSIWRVDVSHAPEPEARTRVISLGQEAIGGPQPSPDGKKLAFQSGTTEGGDIWVSNVDGSSPTRLTNIGHCGVPRWSPDSRWIAFDTDGRSGHAGILVVAPESGTIREIVKDGWNNSVPSWSRDGKWIYFASNRAMDEDENQVWKVSVDDAHQLVQVTRRGGFSGYESLDGRTLYYAKHRYENPEIWEIPVNGGEERRVSSLIRPSTWANWSLTKNGILFLSEYTGKFSTLEFFDFATQGVRPLSRLENASFWLSSSRDGKSVWYSELTELQAHQVFKAGLD